MRLATTALAAVLCLGLGSNANAQDEAADRLVRTFENVCIQTLPYFLGAAERLKRLGFTLTPAGDDEMFELWSEKLGLGGHLHLAKGDRQPTCGFLTEQAKREAVVPLVEATLVNWLGAPPARWGMRDQYAAGWQVPAGGAVLYISVGTSLSDDPAQGASVTVEVRDR